MAHCREGHINSPTPFGVRDLWVELDPGDGPRDVLRGIDLELRGGERVALMGRNGAGKSTLLRCLAGLVDPARGSAQAPGGVALLAQNPSDYLVRERVADELPGDAGRQALEAVGLEWAADRDPRDLSGGERQRLALAIVMAGRGSGAGLPGLVCLDEPTRGMDRARKRELCRAHRIAVAAGAAVLVATHDVEFAATFADRVVLLGDGEAIADGACADVLAGGWYFATEVARILGAGAAITPEQGAARSRRRSARRRPRELAGRQASRASGSSSSAASPGTSARGRRHGSSPSSPRWRRWRSPGASCSPRSRTSSRRPTSSSSPATRSAARPASRSARSRR